MVLSGAWVEITALVAAFAVAVLATPAGVSGAVLLLPFQVSVLGTPSPAVTPTNLLYNVVATPGALYRYWRQHQTGGRLALVLIAGTLPGVIAGAIIRVELLPGPRVFNVVVAAVLLPLGLWLALTRPPAASAADRPVRALTEPNDVRYVGSEVVRRMMDLEDDDAIAPFVEQTAAKRHAYIVEPTSVASWDHRKLT